MEINGGGGRRRISREMSPERSKTTSFASQKEREKTLSAAAKRAQIVYYLSRNGQLEHPHFLEISHLPNQFLRLKDVIQRLTVLRGRGMPSLFSWSCKRSYKNGYVWNDLSENDIIYPADNAEYVLKGSEIIHGCSPPNLDRYDQHLQLSNKNTLPLHKTRQVVEAEEEQGEQEKMEKNASGNCTASDHTAYTHSSTPSSSSSDKPSAEPASGSRIAPFRSDPVHLARNSVLLNFISCGSVGIKEGRAAAGAPATVKGRKSGGSFERESAELQCMSENLRRMGNLRLEEKEYFSGSIVDAIKETGKVLPEPAMKKCSSYNEERGGKPGMEEEEAKESEGEGRVRGKCIPGKKRSSAKQKEQEQQRHSIK